MDTTTQAELTVHFYRVRERVPGWIWQALFCAQKDARPGAVPVVIAGPNDRQFVILDVDAYNALLADGKDGK